MDGFGCLTTRGCLGRFMHELGKAGEPLSLAMVLLGMFVVVVNSAHAGCILSKAPHGPGLLHSALHSYALPTGCNGPQQAQTAVSPRFPASAALSAPVCRPSTSWCCPQHAERHCSFACVTSAWQPAMRCACHVCTQPLPADNNSLHVLNACCVPPQPLTPKYGRHAQHFCNLRCSTTYTWLASPNHPRGCWANSSCMRTYYQGSSTAWRVGGVHGAYCRASPLWAAHLVLCGTSLLNTALHSHHLTIATCV